MQITKTAYMNRMQPYANRASGATGIPADVILAQWALESGSGTSAHSRNNNHGGIKWSQYSKTAIKRSDSEFAAYASLEDFTTDYIRVMKLSYYDKVRSAGSVPAAIKALGESPYDAGHYLINGTAGGKLYQFFGASVPRGSDSVSLPLTAEIKKEIARKAKEGIALSNPSPEAKAYYEQVQSGKPRPPKVCPACQRVL